MTMLPMQRRLIDQLHADTMAVATEAQTYFADMQGGRGDGDPVARVACSLECLKVTTRLMHVIAWTMMRRAVDGGEIAEMDAHAADRRLGASPLSEREDVEPLPPQARSLVDRSLSLHRRAAHLEAATMSDFTVLGLAHP